MLTAKPWLGPCVLLLFDAKWATFLCGGIQGFKAQETKAHVMVLITTV